MSPGLEAARRALGGAGDAWLVGGAVRDRLLGRETEDVDIVVEGDPERAARAVARAAPGASCFSLSEQFGTWRVIARDASWQLDVEPLRGASLEDDLRRRDFTVNAIAEPIAGGAPIDPLGGLADLSSGSLRMAASGAFEEDPLRVLRLVRMTVELGMQPEDDTLASARASAPALATVAAERVFAELCRILAAPPAPSGLALMGALGATAAVLPELEALRGVEQSRFHHLDVYGHTLEVLERTIELAAPDAAHRRELEGLLDGDAGELAAFLEEPLADRLSRAEALRWGALLHDAAKPLTREVRPADGRVTFIGHDVRGAELARDVLGRLRASVRLRDHVAGLVRHHLRLGFLVHEPQPLSARTIFGYLTACSPVQVDVTLLSVADRLATRGARAEESIEAHLSVTRRVLGEALRWHREGPPRPLIRGDELAGALGIAPGPRLGELLRELAAAQYSGEISTREQSLARGRALAASWTGRPRG